MTSAIVENEIDIYALCCTLWCGKRWIISLAVLFALLAWLSSILMKQTWSSTAVTDLPTVNMLGDFFVQQQFINNLDIRNNMLNLNSSTPPVMYEVYHEFIIQLESWDTRRDFWQQTDYFKSRKSGSAHNDAALLDDMITHIQFIPADQAHRTFDKVKLIAENASDSSNLLRQYITYASDRAVRHLHTELKGAWQARSKQLQAQVNQQQRVAQVVFERKCQRIQQTLKVANQQGMKIKNSHAISMAETLPDSSLFLLGQQVLKAQLDTLQAIGPVYDLNYDQNKAVLRTLQAGPQLDKQFQIYRYLRTPEKPVRRDSPRRLFMISMWGVIGLLVGAGVVLVRRPRLILLPTSH